MVNFNEKSSFFSYQQKEKGTDHFQGNLDGSLPTAKVFVVSQTRRRSRVLAGNPNSARGHLPPGPT